MTYALLLVIFVVFAYQNALDAPFMFDDIPNIVLNPSVQPAQLGDLEYAVKPRPELSYRPLASLSFAINYLFSELNVRTYRLTNIAIHVLNALLLFFVLRLFSQTLGASQAEQRDTVEIDKDSVRLAFWGSVLWALSPVQVHAVTYIVQRMTSLSCLFYLLGILFFLLYRQGRLSPVISLLAIAVSFIAGMSCKEIIITLPLALLLIDRVMPDSPRRFSPRLVTAVLVLVGVLALYYLQDRMSGLTMTYPERDFSGIERLMTESRVLWHYLSVWFMPLPSRLQMDYEFVISRSFWQPVTTLISVMAIALFTFIAWRMRRVSPGLSLAVLFFFLASSVEASFINLEIAFIHRLYLPSLFLGFGVLSLLSAKVTKKYALLLWVLVAVLTLGTLQRNQEWNNRAQFWDVDYQRGASRDRAILNHSIGLIESNRSDVAVPLLETISDARQGVDRMLVLNALGTARYHSGEYARAIEAFDLLTGEFGTMEASLYYTGSAFARLGQREKVKEISDSLIDFDTASMYGHLLRAEYQRSGGEPREALTTIQNFIQAHPKLTLDEINNCQVYMADIYLELGEYQQAYDLYNEVIDKDPHQFLAWIQIYRMLKSSGDTENLNKVRAYLESKQVRIPEE